jgi:hypothetical protein
MGDFFTNSFGHPDECCDGLEVQYPPMELLGSEIESHQGANVVNFNIFSPYKLAIATQNAANGCNMHVIDGS